MKTSNKLLIALFTFGLLTLIGANVAIKNQHRQIDYNDPFYGLSSTALKPFRILKLEGNSAGLLGVQTGKSYEIRLPEQVQDLFTYQTKGDTLIVRYHPKRRSTNQRPSQGFGESPEAVILTPTLQMLLTDQVSCNLNHVNTEKLTVIQKKSGVLLTNSSIQTLTVTDSQGSDFHARTTNQIGSANVISRDSSSFQVDSDIFSTLDFHTDSLALVKMPGGLLKRIKL